MRPPPTRNEVSEKYRIGTAADTPTSLRLKAAEFLRLSGETADLDFSEELRLLSALYLERAAELETAATIAVIVTPEGKTTG